MRRPHYLPGNKSSETIHEAIFLDTETDEHAHRDGSRSHHLRFGWAAYVRRLKNGQWSRPDWHRFTRERTLWDFVESKARPKSRLYLFAHNWAFDGLVTQMFTALPERGWTMHGACLDAPPLIVNWRGPRGTIRVLDTLNWWQAPLATLHDAAGLSKLRMPTKGAPRARWDAYCRRDVRVIMRLVTRWADFLRREDLGGFAPTLASQAMRTFRHSYMSDRILIDDNPTALEIARNAYLGGRVECFRIGAIRGPVYVLDVNSMYPAAMRDTWMPARLVGVRRTISPRDLSALLSEFCIIAEARVRLREPCLPMRLNGRLIFPIGDFTGTWTGPELELALSHGAIHSLGRVAVYERAQLFSSFVCDIWRRRQDAVRAGDIVRAHQYKILGNSLYGKFGQRGRRWVDTHAADDLSVRVWEEFSLDTRSTVRYRQIAGVVQVEETEGESRDSHPAIAAHITAEARVRLWQLIIRAGREHVHYCDTD